MINKTKESGLSLNRLLALSFCWATLILAQDDSQLRAKPFVPEKHLPFYEAQLTRGKSSNGDVPCWGHEPNCSKKRSFSVNITKCQSGLEQSEAAKDIFYDEADFGYIKKRLETLIPICEGDPNSSDDASLFCTNQLQFCAAKNLRIDFRSLSNRWGDGSLRYNMEVLKPGQIGGHCRVNKVMCKNWNHLAPIPKASPS